MSVRWNGTVVRNRPVIFHDDVARYFPDSNLMCLSNTTGASWHYPNGTVVGQIGASSDDYVQIPIQTDVDLLRNKDLAEINPLNNGLWTCRLGDLFIPIGIYLRGGDFQGEYLNAFDIFQRLRYTFLQSPHAISQ